MVCSPKKEIRIYEASSDDLEYPRQADIAQTFLQSVFFTSVRCTPPTQISFRILFIGRYPEAAPAGEWGLAVSEGDGDVESVYVEMSSGNTGGVKDEKSRNLGETKGRGRFKIVST